jgi:hypothetical protein
MWSKKVVALASAGHIPAALSRMWKQHPPAHLTTQVTRLSHKPLAIFDKELAATQAKKPKPAGIDTS